MGWTVPDQIVVDHAHGARPALGRPLRHNHELVLRRQHALVVLLLAVERIHLVDLEKRRNVRLRRHADRRLLAKCLVVEPVQNLVAQIRREHLATGVEVLRVETPEDVFPDEGASVLARPLVVALRAGCLVRKRDDLRLVEPISPRGNGRQRDHLSVHLDLKGLASRTHTLLPISGPVAAASKCPSSPDADP